MEKQGISTRRPRAQNSTIPGLRPVTQLPLRAGAASAGAGGRTPRRVTAALQPQLCEATPRRLVGADC